MLRRHGAALAAVLVAAALVAMPVPARADQVRDAVMPVLESLSVPRAWSMAKGRGVTVAVLDSGVDADQADLAGSVTVGPDLTRGAGPPGARPKRLHGTNMASIIAGHGHGPGNALGMIGVAPEARLLSLRVILEREEPGFAAFTGAERFAGTIAEGIRYAIDHGADVINLSLGRSYPTPREREAVAYAIRHNVVMVAAAGNTNGAEGAPGGVGGRPPSDGHNGAEGVPGGVGGRPPSDGHNGAEGAPGGVGGRPPSQGQRGAGRAVKRGGRTEYSYPASFPGVISVAAVDAAGRHAGFSNRNSGVLVSAPGVEIIGAGPDGRYWIGDGTSPATAFVSGIAALIRSRHPGLAPALVTQAIAASTRNRPDRGYDRAVGFGRVDAAAALTASDALAGARMSGAGLPADRRFTADPARPVQVVHRSGGLVFTYLLVCALALFGLAAAAAALRGAPRDPGESSDVVRT